MVRHPDSPESEQLKARVVPSGNGPVPEGPSISVIGASLSLVISCVAMPKSPAELGTQNRTEFRPDSRLEEEIVVVISVLAVTGPLICVPVSEDPSEQSAAVPPLVMIRVVVALSLCHLQVTSPADTYCVQLALNVMFGT